MTKVNDQLCDSAGCMDYFFIVYFCMPAQERDGSATYIRSVNQTILISLNLKVHDLTEWQASKARFG